MAERVQQKKRESSASKEERHHLLERLASKFRIPLYPRLELVPIPVRTDE